MQAEEITRVMQILVQDDGRTLEKRHGQRAVTIAQDIAEVVQYRLSEEAPFDTLWDDFIDDPVDAGPQVTGALEALTEAYPGLNRRLDELMENYDQVVTGTAEGSEVTGSAKAAAPETELTLAEQPDSYSSGTYLVGNVPGGPQGRESEGREIGVEETDFGGRGRLERGALRATAIPGVFRRLYRSVQDYPDLTLAQKSTLDTQLQRIEALLDPDRTFSAADREELLEHLNKVRVTSSDVFEILIQELKDGQSELGEEARKVINAF